MIGLELVCNLAFFMIFQENPHTMNIHIVHSSAACSINLQQLRERYSGGDLFFALNPPGDQPSIFEEVE
jgi:hypothetical protein